tara:strand:- start:1618 stop:2109 length:492 start_codon:yes stop_codon:yes gene_type:complete
MFIRIIPFSKEKDLNIILQLLFLLFFLFFTPLITFSADDPAPKTHNTSQNFYEKGRDFVSKGNWVNAIKSFRHAIQQDQQDHKAYNMLGYSLRQSGKISEAIRAYDRALDLKANYEEALEYRAIAYAKLGKKEKAMQDYKKLLSIKSSFADGLKEKIYRHLQR